MYLIRCVLVVVVEIPSRAVSFFVATIQANGGQTTNAKKALIFEDTSANVLIQADLLLTMVHEHHQINLDWPMLS